MTSGPLRASPLIVAHRGATTEAPANTIAAFDAAIALGADMIEFDVRRTADDELIVIHDDAIGDRLVAVLTYDEVIEANALAGVRVPRVSELLKRVRGRVRLDVELKEAGYEDRVLDLILRHGFPISEFVVTSFEARAIERVKNARPDVKAGLLVYDVTPRRAMEMFLESPADFLGPDCQIIDDWLLQEAAAARIGLLPWTVNDPVAIRRMLAEPAVIGVITDRTAEALAIRGTVSRGS